MPATPEQTERVWDEVVPVAVADRPGPSVIASLLAIAVVALVIAWLFRPWIGAVFFVVFAAALVLERKGPPAARRFAGRIRGLQQRFGAALQRALLAVVWALMVLPLSFLRRGASTHRPVGWQARGADADPAFRRQFTVATDSAGGRGRSRVGFPGRVAMGIGAVVLLVAADVGVGSLVRSLRGPGDSGRADLAAYDGAEWAQEFWDGEEERLRWRYVPYLGWLRDDITTEHVNVRDGERQTRSAASDADGAPVVWLFGGSTAFGTGQRDDHTIASELTRLADDAGLRLDVSNFGVSGYRLWQENLHLNYRLLRGGKPDLVVFYDGVNEPQRHGEVDSATPLHSREHIFRDRLETPPTPYGVTVDSWSQRSALLQAARFARSQFRSSVPGQSVQVAKVVPADRALDNFIGIYGEGVAVSRDIAARHGFEVVHFWQPNLYTKKANPTEADAWDVRGYNTWDRAWFQQVHDGARDRLPDGVIDISDALDATDEPVMIDHSHTNELGARLVAERMFAELRSMLDGLGAQR